MSQRWQIAVFTIIVTWSLVTVVPQVISRWHHNQAFIKLLTMNPPRQFLLECVAESNSTIVGGHSSLQRKVKQNFLKALDWHKQDTSAWIGLGMIDCLVLERESAQNNWARFKNNKQPRAQFFLGLSYTLEGDRERAAVAFSNSGRAWDYLQTQSQIALENGKTEDALWWAELAVHTNLNQESATNLVNLYIKLDQRAEAAQLWQRLASQTPVFQAEHWWALGEKARLQGNIELARVAYSRGVELAKEPHAFLWNLAQTEKTVGNWSEALNIFKQVIQNKPDDQYGYLGAGDMATKLGHQQEALDYYQKARDVAPNSDKPDIAIAFLQIQNEEYEAASQNLSLAIQKKPENAQAFYLLADTFYHLEKHTEAIQKLETALRLSPQSAWWYRLGTWYEEAELVTKAIDAYQSVLLLDSNNKQAQQKLEELQGK